jgi:capsular polysaccharide export protein
MQRSFLVLQGTASPFFRELAVVLNDRKHNVRKVNFCGGDLLYSSTKASKTSVSNYSGTAKGLADWYLKEMQSGSFTDLLMFGDCRRIHTSARPVAESLGIRIHVFEEGYVRPHWVTLEQHGVNGNSKMPRDPAWYREQRVAIPPSPAGKPTGYNLYERAFHDVAYRAANTLYKSRFPNYETHRPRNGFVEYAGLAARALRERHHRQLADKATRSLLSAGHPYFIFPLQLNSDSQIVVHSPFEGVRHAIDKVMRSFAENAPANAWLVIKNHPLDTGLIDYRRYAMSLAREFSMEDRLVFMDAGHLPTLLENAQGAVVVNSTVGLSALHHRCPLIALGTAIYNMDGLTWQGGIDDFWTQAPAPDMALYQTFLDYVVHTTQINGDFYTRTGIAMASVCAADRLEAASHD